MRRRLFPVALVAVVVLAMAACQSGAQPAASGSQQAAGSEDPSSIAVQAAEFKFEPAAITVPAGELTFSVTNVGEVEHEFEIFKGDTVVDEVEGLVPGLTRDLTVTLEPGDYTYVCKLAGHEEQGMTGTLTVE